MRSITFAAIALATLATASAAPAQAQTQPGDGSLVFNPDQRQWALRAAGVPQLCTAGASCVPIQFDGVAPAQIATAEIAGLGFSGGTYYLALRHAEIAGGRQQAFRCVAETCASSELPPGDFAALGTYPLTLRGLLQGGLQTRTAILARPADAPERSRLFVCADRACTEQAFTRDNAADLAFIGAAATDGRDRLWLRERRGTVFGCAPSEAAGEDRLDCRPTAMVFPAGEDSLVFNPEMRQWANRAAGVPSFCMAGGRCGPIRFDRVAAGQVAAAEIAPLGFAGGTYYLALRHPDIAGGRQQAFRCVAEACTPTDGLAGDLVFLGTHSLTLQGLLQSRTAFLARAANAPDRSRLILCSDKACTEQALTRDNAHDLAFMGGAPADGRNRLWLRARNGAVFGCAPPETAGQDRLDCPPTSMVFPDAAAPAGADTSETDAQAMTVAIEDAIRRGNWAEADRLIGAAKSRFPGQAQWAQFERRLTQLRADRDGRARIDRARRLIVDARRYAAAGDFRTAESALQEAAALAPGLAEIAQARADIARMRAERFQRLRERSQFVEAIERALDAFRLWEAEGLIGEALSRFPNDPDFRNFERRMGQMRAQAEWQGRLRRAERHVAAARAAMAREQWDDAERQLDAAEALAMGLPQIRAARADLRRLSADADARATEIRQITIDIENSLRVNDIARAERMLDFAMRRHPAYTGWAALRRRIDAAKAAAPPTAIAPLIAAARAAMARKDWIAANREIARAEGIAPRDPAVIDARRKLDDARSDALRLARRFLADGEAAVKVKNWPAAEKAADEADKADPFNPTVQAAVRKLKSDIAAGKGAGPAPGALAPLLAAANTAITSKNWPVAESNIAKAEAINRADPAVVAARKRLDDGRNAALALAKKHFADAIAAGKAKNWPAAEKAVDDAERADPFNPDVRAEAKKLRDDIAKAKGAGPGPGALAPLLAAANTAITSKNWPVAESNIAKAEAINRADPAVVAARKRLDDGRNAASALAKKHFADAIAAGKAKNWPAADKAVDDAERADPFNPDVRAEAKKLRDDVAKAKGAGPGPGATAPLLAAANTAMASKNWPVAESNIAKAEAINRADPAVVAARNKLNADRAAAEAAALPFGRACEAAIKANNKPAADTNRDQVKARDPFGRVATALRGLYASKGWPW